MIFFPALVMGIPFLLFLIVIESQSFRLENFVIRVMIIKLKIQFDSWYSYSSLYRLHIFGFALIYREHVVARFFVLVKTTVTKVLSLFPLVTLLSPLVCRPLYLILCLVS